MLPIRSAAASCLAMLTCVAGSAFAEPIYGITESTQLPSSLVRFDSATPGAMTVVGGITGLVAGQTLQAIDFRPSNGLLYALSVTREATTAQLYTLDLLTAVLTTVGGPLALTDNNAASVSIDFNPVVDRLRVVTGGGSNYRINPDTQAVSVDTNIAGGPNVSDIAYDHNVAGATSTTLFGYQWGNGRFETIGSIGGTPVSPNSGQRFFIGNSGVQTSNSIVGLDISGSTGIAYASGFDFDRGIDAFFRVDLGTGAFSLVGQESFGLRDFSVFIAAPGVVPEPGTIAVFGLGLLALGLTRRR